MTSPGRRRGAGLRLEGLESRTLLAASVFVDANNTTGVADGTPLHPYATVQAAVTAAPADAVIEVAQGTYAENVVIPDASLQLLGGFAGGAAADYANGQPGDFAAADPSTNVTRITGGSDAPVLFLQNLTQKTVVIDGFVISGGLHGIYCVADYLLFADVTISHNVIENNGPAALQAGGGTYLEYGGGIYSTNATLTADHNTIRNNNANRGGGLFVASKSDFTITDNLIENNSGYDDHGGGVVLGQLPKGAAGTGTFARNVIRGNVAARAYNYGWGGGLLVAGNLHPASFKPLTLGDNVWTGNSAPSIGGAIFVDNGATVVLDHDLIYGNHTDTSGGAIYVDGDNGGVGSVVTITNCTVADNHSAQEAGNGVFVEEFSHVAVRDSIFWGNGDDFVKLDSCTIAVTYTDSQETWPGAGNVHADPLFADPAGGDYHLRSAVGRFDPAAQGGAGGWVVDAVTSPAIDAGDPAAAFGGEPAPNGGRLNLGADGNTPRASRSLFTGPATTTELAGPAGPAYFGAPVPFTATVRRAAAATGQLTGIVHFLDGATELGSVLLTGVGGAGRVRFVTRSLGAGGHAVTAVFDGNYQSGPSTSAAVQQAVNPAATRTTLTLTPRAVVTGQTLKLVARVGVVRPGAGQPTGVVIFKEGSVELGRADLVATRAGVTATLLLPNLGVGDHPITASYQGDADFVASATVLARTGSVRLAPTKTTLTSSLPSAPAGQPVTFTAVIGVLPPGAGTPTGKVTFLDGKTVLGTGDVQLVAGQFVATFTLATLPVGGHRITAVYGGDDGFRAGTSVALVQRVT